jgi:pimeloyl-ACP methyl ester carboxylesterase
MFVISGGGERLYMAYMDVPPEGDSNGRTALLLHGRNFPSSYWQATIKPLSADGRRGPGLDRLRQIVEAPLRSSLHQLVRNTAALLDSLNVEKVDIVAHSMGGMLATRFARTYPGRVRRVVLAGPIGLEDYRLYVPPVPSETLIGQEAKVTPESYRRWLTTAYAVTAPSALDPYVEARTRVSGSAEYPRWLAAYVNSYQIDLA